MHFDSRIFDIYTRKQCLLCLTVYAFTFDMVYTHLFAPFSVNIALKCKQVIQD